MRSVITHLLLFLSLLLVPGCSSDGGSGDPADTAGTADTSDASTASDGTAAQPDGVDESDADPGDTSGPADDDTSAGDDATVEPDTGSDTTSTDTADTDEAGPEYPLETRVTLTVADNALPEDHDSCAVYQQTTCEGGKEYTCTTYATVDGDWAEPDDLLRRVLLYDRYYDLYHQPDGQTADRGFSQEMPAGTPEEEWGDVAVFDGYKGAGDSAIWTGTALNAYLFRFAEFGTPADRERVETKVRRHLWQFEVTGIPGYLARHHYLEVPPGTPKNHDHIYEETPSDPDPRDHPFDPATVPGMADLYPADLGTPMWHGNPSIDQYSGPLTALPMAFDLLEDEALKDRITTQLTCYLKRLEKLEIINVSANPDALSAVQALLGGGALALDPGDIDLTQLDAIYGYYLPQPNSLNADTFDTSCPDAMTTTPARTIDALSDDFLFDLLGLAADMQSGKQPTKTGIDHAYISVRGGDAMHLIHMAAIAWHMTGEEQYLTWLEDEVLGTLQALEIVDIAGAFSLPPWCTSYYGHHITFTPWWGLLEMLEEGPLRDRLAAAFHREMWELTMAQLKNAKFNLMYAGALDAEQAPAREQALGEALDQLDLLGGNGGELDEPRRTFHLAAQDVIDNLPEGTTTRCPSPEERAACEDGFVILGVPIPGEPITEECSGSPTECPMEDGLCAPLISDPGLPSNLRKWDDFIWQRDPFVIGYGGNGGRKQAPGLDLTESYWLARYYDFIEDPKGIVLAWKETGSCE